MILDASSLYVMLKRGNLKSLANSMTLDLAFYEVGNAMLKESKRNQIEPESFTKALGVLASVNEIVTIRRFGELDTQRVAEIARSPGLTFYDASYLALALALHEPLATNDRELAERSVKLGIRVVSE